MTNLRKTLAAGLIAASSQACAPEPAPILLNNGETINLSPEECLYEAKGKISKDIALVLDRGPYTLDVDTGEHCVEMYMVKEGNGTMSCVSEDSEGEIRLAGTADYILDDTGETLTQIQVCGVDANKVNDPYDPNDQFDPDYELSVSCQESLPAVGEQPADACVAEIPMSVGEDKPVTTFNVTAQMNQMDQ